MSNLFSTHEFLETLAATHYRGRSSEIREVEVERQVYRLLFVEGRPVRRAPLTDFLEPIQGAPETDPSAIDHLPRVLRRELPSEAWPEAAEPGLYAAPFVRWSEVGSWDLYLDRVRARASDVLREARRRARRLEERAGPIELVDETGDRAMIALCMAWKSAQYRRTGFADAFADGKNRRFFYELFDRGALRASVLRAGNAPVAVHLGARHGRRFYYWVPAYDPEYSALGPGVLLLHRLLERSLASGDAEFDFLLGSESYKFNYATGARIISHAGRRPPSERLLDGLRSELDLRTREHPRARRLSQSAKVALHAAARRRAVALAIERAADWCRGSLRGSLARMTGCSLR